METESVQFRASGIQKPSKVTTGIPRPGSISNVSGLHEMTSSQTNVRSQPSSSIPAAHGLKRSVPAPAVQSDAKRVPLSKRAGEHASTSITTYQPTQSLRGMALKDVVSNILLITSFESSIPLQIPTRVNTLPVP
ncbi:hypothetical protein F5Y00DRAFT_82387 [Daldinia vernicosa]|uniref:uncharacterized protein n=1 Tax=Daldinia vernicosa TaxID=114800 RepID=UPI0020074607|nr:uncharacterized protein F5Y00DRAFT_82387 [Daldinia vernicosa]KAI0848534.1 hypothetical protein F5Y00DRAFT_82387 [Daldinia vernicosa]